MNSTSRTLLIVIDAFSSNYLLYGCTPNLTRLSEQNLLAKRITPGFTFCEIAQFFTGADSTKTGMFTQFTYDRTKSEYKHLKPILKVASLFSSYNIFTRHLTSTLLDTFLEVVGFKYPIYEIPLNLLDNFHLVEAGRSYYELGAFGVESIIDVMNENGKSFFKDTFVEYNKSKGSDQTRIQKFTDATGTQNHDLYLLYLGTLDSFGHIYGPESTKIREALKWMDEQVGLIVKNTLQKHPETNIIILGDHGMSPVHNYIDIMRELQKLKSQHNLVPGKDYIPFLDSTMCRIWIKNEKARKHLTELFQRMKHGFLLDKTLSRKLGIPEPGLNIGELIWICDEDTVLYPDYFHTNEIVAGMHGYATDSPIHKGFAVIISPDNQPKIIEEAKLIDICPTACDLMGIRYPLQNQGRSLIK